MEAMNNQRNGIGIELEFPEVCCGNIETQLKRAKDNQEDLGSGILVHGNAKGLSQILENNNLGQDSLSLILNGTPYPARGKTGVSSDAPELLYTHKADNDMDKKFRNYRIEENFGSHGLRGNFWPWITQMYVDCVPFLKPGGKMVILIKDMIRQKEPFLLHKQVIDRILEASGDLEYYGSYIHKHIPSIIFINTYSRRWPDAHIPLYQTGIVLQKK